MIIPGIFCKNESGGENNAVIAECAGRNCVGEY